MNCTKINIIKTRCPSGSYIVPPRFTDHKFQTVVFRTKSFDPTSQVYLFLVGLKPEKRVRDFIVQILNCSLQRSVI